MITAVEALQLPSAQLTDEEKAAADGLELLIEEHVRKGMGRNGVDLQVGMTNPKVIAEVNQRLKRAGWATQWSPIIERHKLNAALQNLTGFGLNLFPTDESYKEHERKQLS